MDWLLRFSFFSPFYELGIGIQHELNSILKIEGYILNGWQNVSEYDREKALGTAVRCQMKRLAFNYSNYIWAYQGDNRHFHDINLYYSFSDSLKFKFLYDIGFQNYRDSTNEKFYTFNIQVKFLISLSSSMTFRYENYHDPFELNVDSQGVAGFKANGHSINFDHYFGPLLWRVKYRRLSSEDEMFNRRGTLSKTTDVVLTVMATKF